MMESHQVRVATQIVGATLLLLVSCDAYLQRSGLHVCLAPQSNQLQQPKMQIETYCQPTFKHYFARCVAPSGGYRVCSRYTTMYHMSYRRRYIAPTPVVNQYRCCPGWRQTHKYSKSCTEAICTQECRNGGKCLRPDNCACPSGWTGQYCEIDINECESTSHGCQQGCLNTNGSYTCQCQAGFTLAEDGRSCTVCVSCTPEYQFLVARVNLLERDVAQLKQNQSALSTAVRNQPPPPPPEPELIQQKPPQAISALPPFSDEFIEQIQRIGSLSEQIAMLEERLADCSCRRRHNKGKR